MIKYFLVLAGLSISCGVFAQHHVSRIYSDFSGFWDSSTTVQPNNNHNLLAFTWDADGAGNMYLPKTYSTGVNNAVLTSHGVSYTAGTFISLPIYNVPAPNGGTYVGVGQMYGGNGNVSPVPVHNNFVEYLSDGIQGLGLGTAMFNIPPGSSISLNTMGIVPSSIGDGIPDLIFTQMGEPSGNPDVFYFVNELGNTIGTTYSVTFNSVPVIGNACWKFYNANTNPPTYNAGVSGTSGTGSCVRAVRVLAADWSEFGITSSNYMQAVKLIQTFSGSSDLAFIGAYNEESITFAASISGSVYNDNDAGVPNGNFYSGATVRLLNNGVAFRTATTNASGFYFFDNINTNTYPGPFTVELVVPQGFSVVGNSLGNTSNSIAAALTNGSSQGNNFGINRPPVAGNDTFSAPKNVSKTFNLITNDSDFDGGILIPSSINLITPAGASNISTSGSNIKGFTVNNQGTWNVDNAGILTFTPAQNFFGTASVAQYTIKDNAGLSSNIASINVSVDYCYKPGATGTTPSYTNLGISTLSERFKNWPVGPTTAEGGIPNGFLALNSSDKGMVITRVSSSSAVTQPKKGMIVYDIASQCVKLYNGSVWNCIKRTCND